MTTIRACPKLPVCFPGSETILPANSPANETHLFSTLRPSRGPRELQQRCVDAADRDEPKNSRHAGITTQIEAKSGLGAAGQTQDAKSDLGALTDPTDIWSSINGLRVQELGWQQSLRDGEVVVVAGTISSATIPTATPPPTPGAAMLEYTKAGGGSRLSMIVLHDDAKREYAYGPAQGLSDTKVGAFPQALHDEAKKQDWIVISMKNKPIAHFQKLKR